LESCEEKEDARNFSFLRNALDNADEWEGRNKWETGIRINPRI